jgi:hypothetical protein
LRKFEKLLKVNPCGSREQKGNKKTKKKEEDILSHALTSKMDAEADLIGRKGPNRHPGTDDLKKSPLCHFCPLFSN